MAIVVAKKKVVAAVAKPAFQTSTPPDIAELIEQVGTERDEAAAMAKRIKLLQAQLKPYAEKIKHLAELVSEYAADKGFNPDKEFTEFTEHFMLLVGKAGTQRAVVNVELAMRKMGRKVFLEKCTIGLGVIDQYLTPEERQQVLIVERCVRSIKVLRREQGHGDS